MPSRFSIARQLDRMPFVRMLVPLLAGVLSAGYVTAPAGLPVALLVGGIGAWLLFRGERVRLTILTGLVFTLGLAAARVLTPAEAMPRGERLVVAGVVDDNVATAGRWHRTTARITAWRPDDSTGVWQAADERVSLYVDTAHTVALGDRFSATAYVNPLDTAGGTTGYARTLRSRGVLGRLYVIGGRLIAREPTAPRSGWERLVRASKRTQQAINGQLSDVPMDVREYGIARALLSGDRALLDPELREDYSRAGVSHILAISGLHLGILFALLNYALAPLLFARRGRALRAVLVIGCLWAYAFVSGLSASVLRSAVMLSILQLSMMTLWSYNSYNALFGSAFVLILVRPTFVADMSFQMSYLALLGILFFYPRFSRWTGGAAAGRWLRRRRDAASGARYYGWMALTNLFVFMTGAILLGLAAQIAVAPLVGWAFGRMPLVSVLAGPMIMLVVTWGMVAGFGYLFLARVPELGDWVGAVMGWLLERQNRWIEWVAGWPGTSIEHVTLSVPALLTIYAALGAAMLAIKYAEQRRDPNLLADDPVLA